MTSDSHRYHPRRRYRRFPVKSVPGSLAFNSRAEIVNLSLAGCAVTTSVPLPTGKKFAVRIGSNDENLEFQGTVCWSRLAEDSLSAPNLRSTYRSGLMFSDILTDRAQSLLRFIERNIDLAVDHQLFGRLELAHDAQADLESDYEFTVETLSSGGLGVRMRQPLAAGEEHELELNLDGVPFRSLARVASVEAAEDDRAFVVGLEFLDTSPQHGEILSGYLRRLIESTEPN